MQNIPVYPSHTKTRRPNRRQRAAHRRSLQAKIIAMIFGLAAVAALSVTIANIRGGSRAVAIPAGTQLVAAFEDPISTETARVGQDVILGTTEPLHLSGATLSAGTLVRGAISEVRGRRVSGGPELVVQLTGLEVQGTTYPIVTEPFRAGGRNSPSKGHPLVVPTGQLVQIRLAQTVMVEYSKP